jgi:ribosomal protein L10
LPLERSFLEKYFSGSHRVTINYFFGSPCKLAKTFYSLTEETAKRLSIKADTVKEKFKGRLLLLYGEFDPPPHKKMTEDFYESIKDAKKIDTTLVACVLWTKI